MPKEILNNYKVYIEEEIDRLFAEISTPYRKVSDAARYSLTLGGKRLRPILTLELCKIFGGTPQKAINFAASLEMIHTYSLIHDDLPCMDNDDMRRGKPSCHKAFSEDIALLAGDTLLTEAFTVASKANLKPENTLLGINAISTHAGLHGMIGGQVLDLSFEKANPDAEMLVDMYSRKTSGLIVLAVKLGIIASENFTDDDLKTAEEYGKNLGIAFQIIDDILDYTADEKLLGKPIGSDDKNNKTTFVTLFGIENAKLQAKNYTEKALNSIDKFKGNTEFLKKLTSYLLERSY